MSPLGEDALYRSYEKNPFHAFFSQGLNISLSTDNPLQLHSTNEPLLEEYAVATKMWQLSMCDLSEIARRSVLMSGFEHSRKVKWLGSGYLRGSAGNEISKSNVPDVRLLFRETTLRSEIEFLNRIVRHLGNQASASSLP